MEELSLSASANDHEFRKAATEVGVSDEQLQTMVVIDRIYGGDLTPLNLARAIADRPIPLGSSDKWHCDGIRKLFNNTLDPQKKNTMEMASALSRRASRFMVEHSSEYASLSDEQREILNYIHTASGAKSWDEAETLKDRIQIHGAFIEALGIDFSKTPSEALEQKLTSEELVEFSWKVCGHTESRRVKNINSSLNKKKVLQCSECRRIENSFISWYVTNQVYLDDSGLDISKVSQEAQLESAYSKTKFEVAYGCGHSEETTFQSLKSKHKRALDMGQDRIACNSCKVAEGVFEILVRGILEFQMRSNPGLLVEKQAKIEFLENMPYDIRVTTAGGIVYYIEIDGGFHYRGHSSATELQFLRKVEVDRLKTQTALEQGHRMLRIDERNHKGELTPEIAAALEDAIAGTLPIYTVIGEECPGAAQVSNALKGWI